MFNKIAKVNKLPITQTLQCLIRLRKFEQKHENPNFTMLQTCGQVVD